MNIRAVWRDVVLAESDATIVVEGNHYFPEDALRRDLLQPSTKQTVCPWKGTAHYYDVVVDGEVNPAAAWYYPETSEDAAHVRGRVAFGQGVRVGPA